MRPRAQAARPRGRGERAVRLYGISLANFRSFEGEVEVPFGSITCLIGPSGSGKSNILLGLETIAALLSGRTYEPEPMDYFDNKDGLEMQLGATLELSDGEQRALLARTAGSPPAGGKDHAAHAPFRFVRYMATFRGTTKQKEGLFLSTGKATFHPFARARLVRRGYLVETSDIASVNFRDPGLAPPKPRGTLDAVGVEGLAGMVDPLLFPAMLHLCRGLRTVAPAGGIPDTVPALGGAAIGADGQNLPNEIGHLQEPERIAFGEYMDSVTRGDPRNIGSEPVGSGVALSAHPDGLSSRVLHSGLGSGQIQTLILAWQLFRGRDRILVIKDPELYLHAGRQRQMLGLIRDKSRSLGVQFVVETRSPSFLWAGGDGRTVLVSKDMGRSDAEGVGPETVPEIRRILGLTHADALGADNILLVEGKSERVSFGAFLGSLSPELAHRTAVYSMEGANNIKNAEMLIKCLEGDGGHRVFVILDENKYVRQQVDRVMRHGWLHTNVHFLPKNFEDAFGNESIATAVERMAREFGARFALTADDVQRLRSTERDMASALSGRWRQATGHDLDKARLAELLVSAVDGSPPPDIKRALESAVAHFENSDAVGAESGLHGRAKDGNLGIGAVSKN